MVIPVHSDGSGNSAGITYQVYCPVAVDSGDTTGLRVFNQTGRLVFDSGYRNLKILDVVSVNLSAPDPYLTNPYVDVSHPTIKNPYYVLSPNGNFADGPTSTGYSNKTVGLQQLTSTSVRIGWFMYNFNWVSYFLGSWIAGTTLLLNPTFTLFICEP